MRRSGIIVLVIASVLTLAGLTKVASALWATSATGSASVKAVTAQPLSAVAALSPLADLFPGGLGALQLTVTNPNPYAVSLTSVSFGTVTSSDPTNCPASNLSLGAGGTLGTPVSVPANGTLSTISLPSAVSMLLNAPNACQGVAFTVAVNLSGSQS